MKDIFAFNQTEIILFICLMAMLFLQALYYFVLYNRIHRHNLAVQKGKVQFTDELPPLSVIICAKDASLDLKENLQSVLEQDYPLFEVVVVNDNSSDETEDVLTLMENQYPHLYHTFTPDTARYISHKKLALTVGIKASKYEWLVMTEANCRPSSPEWLRTIARNLTPKTDIVLGYSCYEKSKGWFQRKVSFDNLFNAIRYLGFAIIGKPYMGIGRNMAYRKELFFKNKGFSSHLNLQRGDDDLFINEIATPDNTRVETDPKASIRMQPLSYKKIWKEEKLSYAATSQYYKGMQRYLLGAETTSRLLFYVFSIALAVAGIFYHSWVMVIIPIVIYLIRFTFQCIIINRTAKDLDERNFRLTLPIFDIVQPFANLKFKLIRKFRRKSDFMRR